MGAGHYVDEPVQFMSPQWLDMIDHTQEEAKRLELEMTLHTAGGWSQTGAPWVTPEQAMKKMVWSEAHFTGPGKVGALPSPITRTSSFQDATPRLGPVRFPDLSGSVIEKGRAPAMEEKPAPEYYKDQHVFAFPSSPLSHALRNQRPQVTSNAGVIMASLLSDGRFRNGAPLEYQNTDVHITFQYDTPVTVDGLNIAMDHDLPNGRVEASSDGVNWTHLADLPGDSHRWVIVASRTLSFKKITATHFRVTFSSPAPQPFFGGFLGVDAPTHYTLTELKWVMGHVNRAEAKSGFELLFDYVKHPSRDSEAAIPAASVIDLTGRIQDDGTLDWIAPEGDWTILRIGYALTGIVNHPATDAGRGLEVDKLNAEHVETYMHELLDPIAARSPDTFGKGGIEYLLLDSWEARTQNWTDGIFNAFQQYRGYDPRPYAPALSGYIIQDAATTDRFLWDWRLTLADMLADNHNGVIQHFAKERGIGLYAESMGTLMATMGNGMQLKALADIPMAEFWYVPPGAAEENILPWYTTDIREAASVANIYGQNIVAVEAFTSFLDHAPWGQGPRDLKWSADYYLAEGANRFVIHSSDHQPLDKFSPGFTLWQFGKFITRHQTWAEQSKGFFDYLSRASYLLQHGEHIADIAVFLGEGAPLTPSFWDPSTPGMPDGYDYDYIDAETVLNNLTVDQNEFVTPGGARYKVLYLPQSMSEITAGLAKRLSDLAEAGGVILAPRPTGSPSLADGADATETMEAIAKGAWDSGKIADNITITELLNTNSIARDVTLESDARLKWIHRGASGIDLYFVANLSGETLDFNGQFRIENRDVELWRAETGDFAPANFKPTDRATIVDIHLDPFESVFVVFTDKHASDGRQSTPQARQQFLKINGPWTVEFENAGGPSQPVTFNDLTTWETSKDPSILYYSGTATYSIDFEATEISHSDIVLELGDVGLIAEVTLNGVSLGSDWMPPYKLPVRSALKTGNNHLEIAVTNLWANRLIGDASRAVGDTVTQTIFRPYTPDSMYMKLTGHTAEHPLFPSGLKGPVRLTGVK